MHPIAGRELHEDPLDAGLHRAVADTDLVGDLAVGEAVRHEDEHLPFTIGESVELTMADIGRMRPLRRGARELAHQPLRHRRRQERITAGHQADPVEEILRRCPLQEEPIGPGSNRLVDVFPSSNLVRITTLRAFDVVRGRCGRDPAGRLETVHERHADVEQHNIGPKSVGEPDGRLADDFQIVLDLDHHAQAGPDEHVVIGDQHTDRHRTTFGRGSRALMGFRCRFGDAGLDAEPAFLAWPGSQPAAEHHGTLGHAGDAAPTPWVRHRRSTETVVDEVPVFLLQGAHEPAGRAELLADWYPMIEPPIKDTTVLDTSGHRPLWEQPGEFVDDMVDVVLRRAQAP